MAWHMADSMSAGMGRSQEKQPQSLGRVPDLFPAHVGKHLATEFQVKLLFQSCMVHEIPVRLRGNTHGTGNAELSGKQALQGGPFPADGPGVTGKAGSQWVESISWSIRYSLTFWKRSTRIYRCTWISRNTQLGEWANDSR